MTRDEHEKRERKYQRSVARLTAGAAILLVVCITLTVWWVALVVAP
jgi:hypothetical protein